MGVSTTCCKAPGRRLRCWWVELLVRGIKGAMRAVDVAAGLRGKAGKANE